MARKVNYGAAPRPPKVTYERRRHWADFLKLRYLASRLGSDPLAEWVKYESEGYPNSVEVPDYRIIGVVYTGTFSGAFGSSIRNAPIPPYIICKEAGEQWESYKVRQSVASIDTLIANAKVSGTLEINAANLILLLQGKIYPDYDINSVTGTIGAASLVELQNAVRTRVLELTIQIEKAVPHAAEITLDHEEKIEAEDSQKVNQVISQIIHGNLMQISNTGDNSRIVLQIGQRDKDLSLRRFPQKEFPKLKLSNLQIFWRKKNLKVWMNHLARKQRLGLLTRPAKWRPEFGTWVSPLELKSLRKPR